MKTAAFYLADLLKKLWTLFAVALVLVAVMLSLLRISLPYLDAKKHLIEQYVANQYGVTAKIGQISASWKGLGPAIILYDTELGKDGDSPVSFYVAETAIELDFWDSVRARQIKSERFELSGLKLNINLEQMGSGNKFPIIDALEALFLGRLTQFSVLDSQVYVHSQFNQQSFEIQHLSWYNKGKRHQGTGQMRVQELANNSAYFILDLLSTNNGLKGTFYAKGEELDLSPWINELIKTDKPLKESRGNFVAWAGIDNGRLDSVQIDISESNFAWDIGAKQLNTAIRGGQIRAVPVADGWRFNINNLALQAGDESWVTSWSGRSNATGTLLLNSLDPVSIRPLLPLTPLLLDNHSSDLLSAMSPSAKITNIALYVDKQGVNLSMAIDRLAWQGVGAIPGGKDFSGDFFWQGAKGRLQLQSIASTLAMGDLLEEDIDFAQMKLDLYIDVTPQGVNLYAPEISLSSDKVELSQSFAWRSADNFLSLSALVEPVALADLHYLLPTKYMGPNTRDYLIKAFNGGGKTRQSQILWHGPLTGFPFAQQQGVFQAKVAIEQGDFQFLSSWPSLSAMDMELLFDNQSLSMFSPKATLLQVPLANIVAEIPRLGSGAVLTIDANSAASAEQLTALMQQSSLADSVGKLLQRDLQVTGPLSTQLNLHIPLNGTNVIATGDIQLQDNLVQLPLLDMHLQHSRGTISFVNDQVTTKGLSSQLLGQQVFSRFKGKKLADDSYDADIEMHGDWDLNLLLSRFGKDMQGYIDGHSGWQANVDLLLGKQDFDYSLAVNTSLDGVHSMLPAPFAKTADESLPLVLTSQGNQQASNVSISLGDDVSFVGVLPHKEMQFSRAHLAIGKSNFVGLGVGFSISAALQQVNFSDWYKGVELLIGGLAGHKNSIFTAPERIFFETEQMQIGGQQLDNVEILAKQSGNDWQLSLNAEQARAEILLFHDWLQRGIEVNADFVKLQSITADSDDNKHHWDPANIPPVRVLCQRCWLFGQDLGKVEFALSRQANGMRIDRLNIANRHGQLDAQGNWYLTNGQQSTRMTGNFNSGDFGNFLVQMGLDSGIKDSKANFAFDLSWPAGLLDAKLDNLTGEIKWTLTDGYMTQVSDKGARIFSLFSLDSLVRKLSLDFRDVFAKGFFYDRMKGSFQLADGRIYTEDTKVDGAAGAIEIAGYTDMVNSNLNYTVSFTPNVTGNLPILVYFMVNPPTAIAALALDQVLTSAKVISNINYSITGTIEQPIMTELGRNSKDIALPAKQQPAPAPLDPEENNYLPADISQRVTVDVNNG